MNSPTRDIAPASRASLFRCAANRAHRALAAFLGLFIACNLLGNLVRPGFDANVTWLTVESKWVLPLLPLTSFLLLCAAALPPRRGWRRALTTWTCLFWSALLFGVGLAWYADLAAGRVFDLVPVPVAWVSAGALLWMALRFRRDAPSDAEESSRFRRAIGFVIAFAIVTECFLLTQIYVLGSVEHWRRADCIVVMGSAVNADGTPSLSLHDRTLTGCRRHSRGFAPMIVLSGGVTYGVSEPRAMEKIARNFGVPEERLLIDEDGSSTYESARSVRRIMRARGWRTALVVSHDYHLARTWLAFRRAGIEASTFPAHRTRFFWKPTIFQTFRESVAWPYYWLRPLWEPL